MTSCHHNHHEPVNLIVTGEEVARICVDCFAQLPARWDGTIETIYTWGSQEPVRVIAR